MTRDRAQQVYEQYKASPKLQPSLYDFLTENEIEYVRRVWDDLPGHTSFKDAFFAILRGRSEP
jgi:hypothetical protein